MIKNILNCQFIKIFIICADSKKIKLLSITLRFPFAPNLINIYLQKCPEEISKKKKKTIDLWLL